MSVWHWEIRAEGDDLYRLLCREAMEAREAAAEAFADSWQCEEADQGYKWNRRRYAQLRSQVAQMEARDV